MIQHNEFPLVLSLHRRTKLFLLFTLVLLVLFTAYELAAPTFRRASPNFVDFNVFHLVAELVWEGKVADAYDFTKFEEQQALRAEGGVFMPWTYPAQFNLVLAPLALFEVWQAYLLFMAATFLAYFVVLRKLAGAHVFAVLIFVFPALLVDIRGGQNGLLTAALIGAFCLLLLRNRASAGVPLGLLAIKPHLGVGLVLAALARRSIADLAVATAVTAAAMGAATLAFGLDIWVAVATSIADSSAYLRDGHYPLFRMASVYALVRSWGATASVSLVAQLGMAAITLGGLVWLHMRCRNAQRALGITVLATYLVSPYMYDYDLCGLAIAFALLMPDIALFARRAEKIALAALAWGATGSGLSTNILNQSALDNNAIGGLDLRSLGAVFYLATAALCIAIAMRAERQTAGLQTQR